ncbi:hypothetical protein J6590_091060 [Homalodisca vitripennis]|nr:hypothetical protein J6590_091060 [Homalodisca vitripennis]
METRRVITTANPNSELGLCIVGANYQRTTFTNLSLLWNTFKASQKAFSGIAMLLGPSRSSQNACISSAFSGEETTKCPRGHIWAVGRLRKRWDAGLDQVAVHKKGGVSRGVVVVQLPVGCDVLSDPIDPSFESLEHFHVKIGVDGLSRRNKFMLDDAFDVKKDNEHRFHFAHFSLFWARRRRRVPLGRLPLCLRIILKDPRLVTCDYVIQKLGVTFTHVQIFLVHFHSAQFLVISKHFWDHLRVHLAHIQMLKSNKIIDLI